MGEEGSEFVIINGWVSHNGGEGGWPKNGE